MKVANKSQSSLIGAIDIGSSEIIVVIGKLNNQRFSVESEAGKTSHTKFKFIKCNDLFSHIVALPITGRTHQIRLHCSSALDTQ